MIAESSKMIGLLIGQTPSFVIAMLGALKAGCGFVPLDPTQPDTRLQFIINDCHIEILLTEPDYMERAKLLAHRQESVRHIVCITDNTQNIFEVEGAGSSRCLRPIETAKVDMPAPIAVSPEPEDIVYVVYTSGTTGIPKGVPITHSNLMPLLLWQEKHFHLDSSTRTLQTLSLSFDFGLQEILTTIFFGGTLYFLGREQLRDPLKYARFLNENRITMVYLTPSYAEQIAALKSPLQSLEVVLLGGDILSWRTVEEFRSQLSPRCVVFNGYGPTEASINSTMYRIARVEDAEPGGAQTVPIGQATGHSRVYLLDSYMQPVPIGVPGEVYIGGPGVARGYLNQPVLSAERFLKINHLLEAGVAYRTGDLARRLRDGNLEFLGRIDNQVKIHGYRVEPGEIESVLIQHPFVREAAVILRDDLLGGTGLVAYYVPEPGYNTSHAELRAFLKARLPVYMVPARFQKLNRLPFNQNGKVDRQMLRKIEIEPMKLEDSDAAPRNHLERLIRETWQEVLGVESPGVTDNFFDLGGHSFLIGQVQVLLSEKLGRNIPNTALFEFPTIRSLATWLSDSELDPLKKGGFEERVRTQRKGMLRLRAQHSNHGG
jgi:amino acid adenylation domain-containing protein